MHKKGHAKKQRTLRVLTFPSFVYRQDGFELSFSISNRIISDIRDDGKQIFSVNTLPIMENVIYNEIKKPSLYLSWHREGSSFAKSILYFLIFTVFTALYSP